MVFARLVIGVAALRIDVARVGNKQAPASKQYTYNQIQQSFHKPRKSVLRDFAQWNNQGLEPIGSGYLGLEMQQNCPKCYINSVDFRQAEVN